MHIGLVSFYPPQHDRLSEYAQMLVSHWAEGHEITVFCQKDPCPSQTGKAEIEPCFSTGSPLSFLHTVDRIRKRDPDIVVFNQFIGVWGQGKLANILGMGLPLMVSLMGRKPTFTILHNVYEDMQPDRIERINSNYLIDAGIWFGTRLLLHGSDTVSTTLDRYKTILETKYGASNIVHIPHGTPLGDFTYTTPDDESFEVLAFGHWSPKKGLETLLEAYAELGDGFSLRVGGSDHPEHPGYLEQVREDYPTDDVEFLGYVPEDDIGTVFGDADLIVLPYQAAVGASGVMNLAMGYGVPVLGTQTDAVEKIQQGAGQMLIAEDTATALAAKIRRLKEQPGLLQTVAEANYEAATQQRFDRVADELLDIFREQLGDA